MIVATDVAYDVNSDDIVVDGKPRAANGKGVRAVMHAAFVVSLKNHCFAQRTPHPGFVVVDSPLNPFRGVTSDEEDDPVMRADIHSNTLISLSRASGVGQAILMENIDPPALPDDVTSYVFTGQPGHGRAGFYPAADPKVP